MQPVIVEQQAKLGVSAEKSKAQRLKRQQARFRDRGGAFVPSTSNPLVEILLARTVSGESPSKARPRDVAAKRLSRSKAPQSSQTRRGTTTVTKESQDIAGSSEPKQPVSRKAKAKAVQLQASKSPPKRRGNAKGKKKIPDPDSDEEQPLTAHIKSKSTPKGKCKQRIAPSTSNVNPKAKARVGLNPPKELVEVLVSDDDQTLVEVPYKAISNSKRDTQYADDGESDDDVPIVRKRIIPRVSDSKTPGTKVTTHVKIGRTAGTGSSRKKALEDGEGMQDERCKKTTAKKRVIPPDEDEDEVAAPPLKKGKGTNSSAKPKTPIEVEVVLVQSKDTKNENTKAPNKRKGKGAAMPVHDLVSAKEEGGERPSGRISKLKKRKKEEDNYDDRPRKAVKFSEPGPPHSSSQKLKENLSERKRKSTPMSNAKDDQKPATKPPLRTKSSKGPPREVLERIKASAARHLRCPGSEPDELDCLS